MITRREAIKTTALAAAATALAPSVLAQTNTAAPTAAAAPFTLPPLPYATDALEPHIDARTMEIHHGRHHKAYVDGLNKIYTGMFEFALPKGTIDQIAENLRMRIPEISRKGVSLEVQAALQNNAGGHYNHSLFWQTMKKGGGGEPKEELAKAIDASFGNFGNFREAFTKAALSVFGSGWVWLSVNEDVDNRIKLKLSSSTNQDSPIMIRMTDFGRGSGYPVLGLDVWEHAYYLKYQNKRADYITAWWNVVNWDFVTERFQKAKG